MKKNIILILLLVVILLTATLSLANMQTVEVNYLFGTFKTPLILLILMSVLLGFIIHSLINFPKSISNRYQLSQLRKELKQQHVSEGNQLLHSPDQLNQQTDDSTMIE